MSYGSGSPYLCTNQEVKDALIIGATAPSSSADLIDALIEAATSTIAATYGREFVQAASGYVTRSFRVDGRLVDLAPYDLRSVGASGSVTLNPEDAEDTDTLVANTDYVLLPFGGDALSSTYTYLRLADDLTISSDLATSFGFARLDISGLWGMWANAAAVPADVNRAAVETVMAWLDRPAADMAMLEGGEPIAIMPAVRGWAIPSSAHSRLRLWSRSLGVY